MEPNSLHHLSRAIESAPGRRDRAPERNPFLRFHRAAEAAGYPALLMVSMASLSLMVAAIALLAVVQAAWALATALMALIVAVGALAGAVGAAFSDTEQSTAASPEPLRRREVDSPPGEEGRRAA